MACVRALVRSFIYSSICLSVGLFVCLFVHPSVRACMRKNAWRKKRVTFSSTAFYLLCRDSPCVAQSFARFCLRSLTRFFLSFFFFLIAAVLCMAFEFRTITAVSTCVCLPVTKYKSPLCITRFHHTVPNNNNGANYGTLKSKTHLRLRRTEKSGRVLKSQMCFAVSSFFILFSFSRFLSLTLTPFLSHLSSSRRSAADTDALDLISLFLMMLFFVSYVFFFFYISLGSR